MEEFEEPVEYDYKKIELLYSLFSPSAPIKKKDLFFGRIEQISKVGDTVSEDGLHAVLYGERGVGKTSFANIISEIFPFALTVKVTCNRTENFKSIWSKALKKIKFQTQRSGIGFNATPKIETIQFDLFIQEIEEPDSTDIENILENLNNRILFIFDEFDSIADPNTKVRMADTIKALSDNCPNVTILIVGIAENVNDLIGEHPSLQRCLKQIKMPRMSDEEQTEIVIKNYEKLNLQIENEVLQKILNFSVGFPHFTHLLAKYSAEEAIMSNKVRVDRLCFNKAAIKAIENTNESLRTDFQKATISSKTKTKFEDVIFAASQCNTDEYDCFSATELIVPYDAITGTKSRRENLTYSLNELCEENRGKILEKIGQSKNVKYRFKNPLMKAFVKLKLFNLKKHD